MKVALDQRIKLLEERLVKLRQALPFVEMGRDASVLQRRLDQTKRRLEELRKARERTTG